MDSPARTTDLSNPGALRRFWGDRRVIAVGMIAPAILYIVSLVGFPFVLAIYYSLSDATTGSASIHFVGLRNFAALFDDPVFVTALWNTVFFTVVSQALV